MPISMEHLNTFSKVFNTYKDRETLKLGDSGVLKGDGKLRYLSTNLVRSDKLQASNNAVRAALLANLGRTFHLNEGKDALMTEGEGGVRFSAGFMDKLKELLGEKVIKADDFNVTADGVVSSGKPLTARRVRAILTEVASRKQAEIINRQRYDNAVESCTNRIVKLLGKNVNTDDEKGYQTALRKLFGATPEKIRESVKFALLRSPSFMKLCAYGQWSETCKQNLADLFNVEIADQFGRALKDPENKGLYWEALRTGTDKDRFVHVTVDGKSYGDGTLADDSPEYVKAHEELSEKDFKWDQGNSPFFNPAQERLFTTLKARIQNLSILKVLTSQLGLNSGASSMTLNAFLFDKPLEIGEGMDLRQMLSGWGDKNTTYLGFTADPLVNGGSADITFRDNSVVLTQKFHVGPQILMLDGKAIVPTGHAPVDVPFYMATSTITIPLDQNPPYGTMPQYTTTFAIEDL